MRSLGLFLAAVLATLAIGLSSCYDQMSTSTNPGSIGSSDNIFDGLTQQQEIDLARQLAWEYYQLHKGGDDDMPDKPAAGDDDTPDKAGRGDDDQPTCGYAGPPLCKNLADDVLKCTNVCGELFYQVLVEDEWVCVHPTGSAYECNGF